LKTVFAFCEHGFESHPLRQLLIIRDGGKLVKPGNKGI
jgi:hypothetical protein